jgi:hypothetical protein
MATRITDRDEEEDRPAKKKKKKQQAPASPAIFIIIGVAVFVVLLAGGGGLAYYLFPNRQPADVPQAKVEDKEKDENKGQIFPRREDGSPTKKGGKDIVQNIRGAVWRTERKNELKQLQLSFIQYSDDYKPAARTKENFLEFIKTFGPIRDAVKEGYYVINLKARLQGGDIIAYERDEDNQGHLCVRSNGEMSYVPAAQLKKELGLP